MITIHIIFFIQILIIYIIIIIIKKSHGRGLSLTAIAITPGAKFGTNWPKILDLYVMRHLDIDNTTNNLCTRQVAD